jgi:monothiol glutaredoxin
MSDPVHARIAALVSSDHVVLFMKGNRDAPQCGFSATVVGILDKYVPNYTTVDVLADPDVRNGVKDFSDWPTIPQLYVRGEFLGGCDIVREMDDSGDLFTALGDAAIKPEPPAITVTEAAAKVFAEALKEGGPDDVLRLSIDAGFRHDLALADPHPSDLRVQSAGLTFVIDPGSARRAEGLTIDYVDGPQSGFKMDNPNAPARVERVSARDVKQWLDAGESFEFIDVRPPAERELAKLEGTRLLDKAGFDAVSELPKDTKLVFLCHHGMRSFQAAEHFSRLGFRKVFNLEGGIEAWATQVDDSIPRY